MFSLSQKHSKEGSFTKNRDKGLEHISLTPYFPILILSLSMPVPTPDTPVIIECFQNGFPMQFIMTYETMLPLLPRYLT